MPKLNQYEMKKLILDTNVVVSSLIQKGYPFLIVQYCLKGNVKICLSNPILKEYSEVLNRPKFLRFPDFRTNADFFLSRLSQLCEIYEPSVHLDIIKDEPDNRFLELAESTNADFIITGNSNDFNMKSFKSTKIVSPKIYWENHKT